MFCDCRQPDGVPVPVRRGADPQTNGGAVSLGVVSRGDGAAIHGTAHHCAGESPSPQHGESRHHRSETADCDVISGRTTAAVLPR